MSEAKGMFLLDSFLHFGGGSRGGGGEGAGVLLSLHIDFFLPT